MKKNEKGFSVIELIVALLIIGLIAAIGWIVYDKNRIQPNDTPTSKQETIKEDSQDDITKDWLAFKNTEGKFSVEHPDNWVVAKDTTSCQSETLSITLMGTKESVGTDCYGNQGQISLGSSTDTASDHLPLETSLESYKKTPVTVNKVEGLKVSGTLKDADTYYEKGTEITSYSFIANDRVYFFQYRKNPSFPDLLNSFNTMITKTLVFN